MNTITNNQPNLTLTIENVDFLKEAKTTLFGFTGENGVIRNSITNEILGFFNFKIDAPTISLTELEIILEKQNQGYGKLFIKTLFNQHPEIIEITGLATEESEGFYISIGAEFDSFCKECDISNCSFHSEYEGIKDYSFHKCDDYSTLHFKILKDNILKAASLN